MIRALRARHRVLVAGVAVVAGGLGVAALTSRREVPRIDLPPALVAPAAALPRDGGAVTLEVDEPAAAARLGRAGARP